MEQNKDKEVFEIEERTLEQLLKDLRESKNWSYINVVEELNKIGLVVNDKQVKKWELGIEYPDINIIYKISELYLIPSEKIVMAKNNSFSKGLQSVHMFFIRWFCYFTNISLKVALIGVYAFIGIALIGAFAFFIDNVDRFMEVRRVMK